MKGLEYTASPASPRRAVGNGARVAAAGRHGVGRQRQHGVHRLGTAESALRTESAVVYAVKPARLDATMIHL